MNAIIYIYVINGKVKIDCKDRLQIKYIVWLKPSEIDYVVNSQMFLS